MTDKLFARINNESMIHIVEHDDPGEPGYIWVWCGKESDDVYESKYLALIGAINFLSLRCAESMSAFKKAKEESIKNENAADRFNRLIPKINRLTEIKFLPTNNPDKVGYFWRWEYGESDVYLTQELALIGWINYICEDYENLNNMDTKFYKRLGVIFFISGAFVASLMTYLLGLLI